MDGEAFFALPARHCPHTALEIAGDLLPGVQLIARHRSHMARVAIDRHPPFLARIGHHPHDRLCALLAWRFPPSLLKRRIAPCFRVC